LSSAHQLPSSIPPQKLQISVTTDYPFIHKGKFNVNLTKVYFHEIEDGLLIQSTNLKGLDVLNAALADFETDPTVVHLTHGELDVTYNTLSDVLHINMSIPQELWSYSSSLISTTFVHIISL